MKFHLNSIVILSCLITITSQLNYFYGYKRGIDPTFVRVFHTMSSSVSPTTMGLYRNSDLKSVKKFQGMFRIIGLHNKFMNPVLIFILNFGSYVLHENVIKALMFGLSNSILFSLHCYFGCDVLIYQVSNIVRNYKGEKSESKTTLQLNLP